MASRKRRSSSVAALVALAIALISGAAAARLAPVVSPAEASSGRPVGWYATIETSLGAFTVHLLPEQAPQTVAHFAGFAQGKIEYTDAMTGNPTSKPLYDGITIHRVTRMQRLEAGDPTGTGRGAPPFWVPREPGPVDFSRPYRIGTTSASMRRLSGALFFVNMVAEPYLSAAHNAFGEVVEGRDVVDKICAVATDENKVPLQPVTIKTVRVFAVGDPKPLPAPVRYKPEVPVPEVRAEEPR